MLVLSTPGGFDAASAPRWRSNMSGADDFNAAGLPSTCYGWQSGRLLGGAKLTGTGRLEVATRPQDVEEHVRNTFFPCGEGRRLLTVLLRAGGKVQGMEMHGRPFPAVSTAGWQSLALPVIPHSRYRFGHSSWVLAGSFVAWAYRVQGGMEDVWTHYWPSCSRLCSRTHCRLACALRRLCGHW